MNENLRIIMIGPLAEAGGVASHTKHLTKALRDKDLSVILYNSNFEGKYFKILVDIIKMYRRTIGLIIFALRVRKSYDIIHVQTSGGLAGFLNAISGAMLATIIKNKKLVITFHYGKISEFIKRYGSLVNFVYNKSNYLILVSNIQKRSFIRFFQENDKIKVIPNGYDSSIFLPIDKVVARKRLNLDENKKIIINVANLKEVKGQQYLIKSMQKIKTLNYNDILLYIIGSGIERNNLLSDIKKFHLHSQIKLVGSKPHSEIPLWMNSCDIFIFPSLNESFGIAQVEAMACGKPVVASRNGGSEDLISNNKLGILVEPGNSEELAEAIINALGIDWDPYYIQDYAKELKWDIIAERTLKVYESLLDQKSNLSN